MGRFEVGGFFLGFGFHDLFVFLRTYDYIEFSTWAVAL